METAMHLLDVRMADILDRVSAGWCVKHKLLYPSRHWNAFTWHAPKYEKQQHWTRTWSGRASSNQGNWFVCDKTLNVIRQLYRAPLKNANVTWAPCQNIIIIIIFFSDKEKPFMAEYKGNVGFISLNSRSLQMASLYVTNLHSEHNIY